VDFGAHDAIPETNKDRHLTLITSAAEISGVKEIRHGGINIFLAPLCGSVGLPDQPVITTRQHGAELGAQHLHMRTDRVEFPAVRRGARPQEVWPVPPAPQSPVQCGAISLCLMPASDLA
jgi:hypothetical protein